MCPKCGNPREYRYCLDKWHDTDPRALAEALLAERRKNASGFLNALLDAYEITTRNPFS